MQRRNWMAAAMALSALSLSAAATEADEIALPDGIVYGLFDIEDGIVSAGDDVTVIARLDGLETAIALYQMGENPTAGNHFVLRFPYNLLADGKAPGSHSARAGQVASIYLKIGRNPERYVTQVVVPESGEITQATLPDHVPGVSPAPNDVASSDTAPNACGLDSGACGATGLFNLCLMWLGLGHMRKRRIASTSPMGRGTQARPQPGADA